MTATMSAAQIMASWLPGSNEQPWTWEDEGKDIASHDTPANTPANVHLIDDVATNGIREPVSLGRDGRVWDGHHRILIAHALNLPVPYEMVGEALPADIPLRDLDLDVPSAEMLAALYRAEHDAFTGTAAITDDDGEPWLLHGFGMGATEQCAVFPTDDEMAAHRRHVVERILHIDQIPNRKAP